MSIWSGKTINKNYIKTNKQFSKLEELLNIMNDRPATEEVDAAVIVMVNVILI